MSQGVFAIGLGGVLAGVVGGFSTIVYPDNIGMLRATRVGSRYATLAAGVLLIVLGACVKFDLLLVIVPIPVLSAAATLLFGIVLMHGVHILARVEWDDRKFIVAGLSMLVALGGMFLAPDVLAQLPLLARLLITQPVISGGLTLVVLHTLLAARRRRKLCNVRPIPGRCAHTYDARFLFTPGSETVIKKGTRPLFAGQMPGFPLMLPQRPGTMPRAL